MFTLNEEIEVYLLVVVEESKSSRNLQRDLCLS